MVKVGGRGIRQGDKRNNINYNRIPTDKPHLQSPRVTDTHMAEESQGNWGKCVQWTKTARKAKQKVSAVTIMNIRAQ